MINDNIIKFEAICAYIPINNAFLKRYIGFKLTITLDSGINPYHINNLRDRKNYQTKYQTLWSNATQIVLQLIQLNFGMNLSSQTMIKISSVNEETLNCCEITLSDYCSDLDSITHKKESFIIYHKFHEFYKYVK